MTALMRKGTGQFITEKDLPPLLDQDKSANLGRDLKKALEKQYVMVSPSKRSCSNFGLAPFGKRYL